MKIEPRPMCSCGKVHPIGESCDISQNNLDELKTAYDRALKELGKDSAVTATIGMNIALSGNDAEKIEIAAREILRTMEKTNILYLQSYFILLQTFTDRRMKKEAFAVVDEIYSYLETEEAQTFTKEVMINFAGSSGLFLKAFGEKTATRYIDKAIDFAKDKSLEESEGYALLLTAKAQILEGDSLMCVDSLPLMEEAFNILVKVDGYDSKLTEQVFEDIMDQHIKFKSEKSYVDAYLDKILSSIEDKESDTYISYALTPGAYYINRGMEDEAIELADRFIEKREGTDPLHLQAIYLKALAEQSKGNHRQALRLFTKLKEITVGFYRDGSSQIGTVLSSIAFNAEKVGRYELAAKSLEELIARNAPSPSLGSRLDVLMKLRDLYQHSGHQDLADEIDMALSNLKP